MALAFSGFGWFYFLRFFGFGEAYLTVDNAEAGLSTVLMRSREGRPNSISLARKVKGIGLIAGIFREVIEDESLG